MRCKRRLFSGWNRMASARAQKMAPMKGHRITPNPALTAIKRSKKVRLVVFSEGMARWMGLRGLGWCDVQAQTVRDLLIAETMLQAVLHKKYVLRSISGTCLLQCTMKFLNSYIRPSQTNCAFDGTMAKQQQARPLPQSHPPIGTAVSREVYQPAKAFSRKAKVSGI